MRAAKDFYRRFFLFITIVLFLSINQKLASQVPEVLDEGTLKEQFDFLHERTNIYNNFRAIREDMFQKIRRNSTDSLNRTYRQIALLNQELADAETQIDSLNLVLNETFEERDQAIRDRDSLFLLGIPMQKTFYNLVLWSIIGALAVLLVIGFFVFKRNRAITVQTTNDLKELREEFETYRKTSRERFEQQAIDHFNEIKRLKGRV
jgi:hypothetical protein